MSKSKKRMFKRLFVVVIIFSLSFVMLFTRNGAEAASLTSIQDTMSRLEDTTLANHTIQFVTPTGVDADTDTITITFENTFNMGSVAFGDMDLDIDTTAAIGDCASFVTSKTLAANPVAGTWGVLVAGQVVTLTAPNDAAVGEIAAGSCVQVKIGTNATGGSNQILNATSSGSKTIAIAGDFGDSGSLAVPIMSGDQVTVTAAVDPTITSILTGAGQPICALGTLSDAAVQGCLYTNTVSTNATSGYNSTIVEDGDLCSPSVTTCTNSITDVADGTITIAAEEYGVSTSDADAADITATYDGTCADGANETGSAITGTAQIYADETAAIANDGTDLCHSASITATTEAGNYSHVVTHVTTGNF